MTGVQILILLITAIAVAFGSVIVQKLLNVEDPLLITGAITGAISAAMASRFIRKNKGIK
jgi:predicted membrane protein